ncbi:hypothetical protein JYU17_00010 [Flavobacteriaceae bacterium AH-315-O20]|nr:hypothetical protein [Flavobacteriaceae bacterium AH-315-O20]
MTIIKCLIFSQPISGKYKELSCNTQLDNIYLKKTRSKPNIMTTKKQTNTKQMIINNSKKILFFICALFFFNVSFAQDYSIEEVEIFQNLFGAEKKAIIEGNIDLNGVDANTFWGLYQEYETFRKEIGKKKLELLKQYTTKSSISRVC